MPALTDQVPPPAPPPLFRTTRASDAVLLGLRPDGPPQRQFWDTQRIVESQKSESLFRLTTAVLPSLEAKKPKRRDSAGTFGGQESPSQLSKASKDSKDDRDELSADSPGRSQTGGTSEPPRRQKYYDLLMKHHNKRLDKERKDEESAEKQRRLNAAKLAERKRLQAELKAMKNDSDSDTEEEEEVIEGDFGDLTEYDGVMKVDLELVVLTAPKQKKKKKEKKPKEKHYKEIVLPNGEIGYETDSAFTPASSSASSFYSSSSSSSQGSGSRRRGFSSSESGTSSTVSTKSSESTPRLDIAAELQALQEELGSESESSGSDGLPGHMKEKDNPWESANLRWTLGIGGTVFFVPDAERYGHAPSLPPPPPPSLLGPGRVRVKPRLPLDISNHRYRDEHPNVWLPDPYNPSKDDRKTFEQKLMTMDFYASCSKSLTRLPPLERERDAVKHEVALGHMVEGDTKTSFAWKSYLEKDRRKTEKDKKKKAVAGEPAAGGEASTTLGERSTSQTLQEPSTAMLDPALSLEAGPSVVSVSSIGMPSEVGGPGYAPG